MKTDLLDIEILKKKINNAKKASLLNKAKEIEGCVDLMFDIIETMSLDLLESESRISACEEEAKNHKKQGH